MFSHIWQSYYNAFEDDNSTAGTAFRPEPTRTTSSTDLPLHNLRVPSLESSSTSSSSASSSSSSLPPTRTTKIKDQVRIVQRDYEKDSNLDDKDEERMAHLRPKALSSSQNQAPRDSSSYYYYSKTKNLNDADNVSPTTRQQGPQARRSRLMDGTEKKNEGGTTRPRRGRQGGEGKHNQTSPTDVRHFGFKQQGMEEIKEEEEDDDVDEKERKSPRRSLAALFDIEYSKGKNIGTNYESEDDDDDDDEEDDSDDEDDYNEDHLDYESAHPYKDNEGAKNDNHYCYPAHQGDGTVHSQREAETIRSRQDDNPVANKDDNEDEDHHTRKHQGYRSLSDIIAKNAGYFIPPTVMVTTTGGDKVTITKKKVVVGTTARTKEQDRSSSASPATAAADNMELAKHAQQEDDSVQEGQGRALVMAPLSTVEMSMGTEKRRASLRSDVSSVSDLTTDPALIRDEQQCRRQPSPTPVPQQEELVFNVEKEQSKIQTKHEFQNNNQSPPPPPNQQPQEADSSPAAVVISSKQKRKDSKKKKRAYMTPRQLGRPNISCFPFGKRITLVANACSISAFLLSVLTYRSMSFVTLRKSLFLGPTFYPIDEVGMFWTHLCMNRTAMFDDLDTQFSGLVTADDVLVAKDAVGKANLKGKRHAHGHGHGHGRHDGDSGQRRIRRREGDSISDAAEMKSSSSPPPPLSSSLPPPLFLRRDDYGGKGGGGTAGTDSNVDISGDCRDVRLGSDVVTDNVWNISRSFLTLATALGCLVTAAVMSSVFWETINLRAVALFVILTYLFQSLSFFFFDTEICRTHRCRLGKGAIFDVVASSLWFVSALAIIKMDLSYRRKLRKLERKMRRRRRKLLMLHQRTSTMSTQDITQSGSGDLTFSSLRELEEALGGKCGSDFPRNYSPTRTANSSSGGSPFLLREGQTSAYPDNLPRPPVRQSITTNSMGRHSQSSSSYSLDTENESPSRGLVIRGHDGVVYEGPPADSVGTMSEA